MKRANAGYVIRGILNHRDEVCIHDFINSASIAIAELENPEILSHWLRKAKHDCFISATGFGSYLDNGLNRSTLRLLLSHIAAGVGQYIYIERELCILFIIGEFPSI